jgi:CHAD domain-containing protein
MTQTENEKGMKSAAGDDHPAATVAEAPAAETIRRGLTRLLRKRVKRFVALTVDLLKNADPKAVHDARVWSRRLQQAISAFFPKPRSGKVRRLRRTPQQVRRMLGDWRNCDVLLGIVERQQRRTRSELKRQAWNLVKEDLLQKRGRQVARIEKELGRLELANFAALAQKLMDRPLEESSEVLMWRLWNSAEGAWGRWQSALARARQTRAVNELHGFRIATKNLRYRTELLYDLGQRQMKPQLKWLEDLQQGLGVWHGRQVLNQAVAEAVARAEIVLNEPQAVRILLAELEKDRSRQIPQVDTIFRLAIEQAGRQPMQRWSENVPFLSPLPQDPRDETQAVEKDEVKE